MINKKQRFLSLFLFATFLVLLSACGKTERINNNGNVYYEIFVGGFYDSDDDGLGDLTGVKEKLPYLKSLGISGLWLMPIHPSPTYHKYDSADYYSIDPDYGTIETFKELVSEAKKENIDIIMDLVLNHTSVEHPWFKKALSDYKLNNQSDESFSNFYNFSDVSQTGYAAEQGVYYEARFWSGMPDLNLDEPKVRHKILDIAKYWLDMGVKGFRLDAVTYLYSGNDQKNIEFLSWINESLKSYKEDTYIVAEAWTDNYTIEKYYGSGLDSFFNFGYSAPQGNINIGLLSQKGDEFAKEYVDYVKKIKGRNSKAEDALFLTNHDQDRSGHFLSNPKRAKFAASLYLLMGGKPFIYYGEELGILGNGKDENKRLPMLWNKEEIGHANPPKGYDFSISNNQVKTNVDEALKDKESLLNHYIKVISIHNKYQDYLNGTIEYFNTGDANVAGFRFISAEEKSIIILHNFSVEEKTVSIQSVKLSDQINIINKSKVTKQGVTLGGYNTVILTVK